MLSHVSVPRFLSLNWRCPTDRNIDAVAQPDWQLHESLLARWSDAPVGWDRVQSAASDIAQFLPGPEGGWSRIRQEIINNVGLGASWGSERERNNGTGSIGAVVGGYQSATEADWIGLTQYERNLTRPLGSELVQQWMKIQSMGAKKKTYQGKSKHIQ